MKILWNQKIQSFHSIIIFYSLSFSWLANVFTEIIEIGQAEDKRLSGFAFFQTHPHTNGLIFFKQFFHSLSNYITLIKFVIW